MNTLEHDQLLDYLNAAIALERSILARDRELMQGLVSGGHRDRLTQMLAEMRLALDRLYDQNVVYTKYRSLPALMRIYEYLLSGRCDALGGALGGAHGAYNLYEDETRRDATLAQLSELADELRQLRHGLGGA